MRQYVEAPPVTPAPFGLLSVATVLELSGDEDAKQLLGTQWQPEDCGFAWTTTGPCAPDLLGTVTVLVDDSLTATITSTATGPGRTVIVEWGDTASDFGTIGGSDDLTHTYDAPGEYVVTVQDATGMGTWEGGSTITVADGEPSDPVTITADRLKTVTDGIPVETSDPFAVYKLTRCRLVGGNPDTVGAERARRALQLGEDRAVQSVMAELMALRAGEGNGLINGLDPVHPVTALGLLEDYARAEYGGTPTLHLPVHVVTQLTALGAIIRVGTQLQTVQGSLVASGYTSWGWPLSVPWEGSGALEPPEVGAAVGYVTGQVIARRASTIEVTASSSGSREFNEGYVLAERLYDVGWECITGAILMAADAYAGGGTGGGGLDGGTP